MKVSRSRRVRALENLPISRELVKYRRVEAIPITSIAKRFNVSNPRVVSFVGALMKSDAVWERLAGHYRLSDEDRPP